jgi:hypothetical protein
MSKILAAKRKSPTPCRACIRWSKERARLKDVLKAAIDKMQESLEGAGFKPTIGDYLKLVQIEKEMDEAASDGKEIRVTWVEPTDSQSEE